MKKTIMRARLNAVMAFRTLGDRPSRTALTLLGIVIGILALVVMMALIGGLSASVAAATRPLGAGVFQIQKEPRFTNSRQAWEAAMRRKSFDLTDLEELRSRLTLTEAVGGEMWAWPSAFKTSKRQTTPACGLAGGDPPFLEANGFQMDVGRFIDERDIRAGRDVIVIGADLVDTLFPGGPNEAMGQTVRVQGASFTVIGTMKRKPSLFGAAWRNCVGVVPISSFQRTFGFRSLHITFLAADRDNPQPAIDEAILATRSMRRLKPGEANDFEWFDNQSAGEELGGLTLAVTAAAGAICLIALLVGGVGVMNIMLVSVMERTREIGVRKALGARPSTILGQFLTEAVVLTASGGAIGVVLAEVLVMFAARALELPATVPTWTVFLALGSSALIGLAAGLYPAAKASRLDPIEALRYE